LSASKPFTTHYVGRFAPSPTGDLHFGSLVAAVASYLQARKSGGKWLLRIEDVDPPREVPGSAASITDDLAQFGMIPDGLVLYQSRRTDAYQRACEFLLASGHAYWCGCSRKDLPASGVYPGTCRDGMPAGKERRAIRLRTVPGDVSFQDLVQGWQTENLQATTGDFVIRRADGLFAYQLAVVVDDAFQHVTEVVRGADLLDSTARQIFLQSRLGLPTPRYAHVPVVLQADGSKLSKRDGADPIHALPTADSLRLALTFLGHAAPRLSLAGTWEWALDNWSLHRIPPKHTRPSPLHTR
jgi:glutamyl-Q tRNA(Asp) synthetase